MYSTCLFCHTTLGANEAVEHFPVGRRLAFDAAKGRLWVVCRKCERWNLTPVEERWEAIEECERSFRDTKLRVSTDQIGLSRLERRARARTDREAIAAGVRRVAIRRSVRKTTAPERCSRSARESSAAAAVAFSARPSDCLLAGSGYYLYSGNRTSAWGCTDARGSSRASVTTMANLHFVRTYEVTETVMLPPTADKPWGLRVKHRAPEYSARHGGDTPKTQDRDRCSRRGRGAGGRAIVATGQSEGRVGGSGEGRGNDRHQSTTIRCRVRSRGQNGQPTMGRTMERGPSWPASRLSCVSRSRMASHEESEQTRNGRRTVSPRGRVA